MKIFLDIADLLEFLSTSDVLYGVQNVTYQVMRQLWSRPSTYLIGFHPVYGRPFSLELAQISQESLAESARFSALLGLDGRRLVKSPAAIGIRHAGRPVRQLFEHAKRRLRMGVRSLFSPVAPLCLLTKLADLNIAAGDLVIVPGLNVWYPEHNRELGRLIRRQGARLVVVVHDLGPLTAARYFPPSYRTAFRGWMESLFPYADLFVADSEHTRREMAALDPALRGDAPCLVNPLAHEFALAADGTASSRPEIEALIGSDYVLHVGRIEPRKNLVGLVTVWGRLAHEFGPALPLLVLAGRKNDPDGSFDAALKSIGTAARHVRFVADLSPADLARLYGGCRFAVYPSFFEGWGLPIGEAASFGKVTAASNAASISEVIGDLAVYFDPHDLDGMAAVLRRLIADRESLAALEARLKAEFHPRSWADCAARLIAIASKETRAELGAT